MVAIGGVGGSGTRVIAQILNDAGYFIGNDINVSNDNLLFTLLFKRENILVASDEEIEILWNIFLKIMYQESELHEDENKLLLKLSSNDRTLHEKKWLEDRLKFLKHKVLNKKLAFKEPNSHIVIERLFKLNKNMKFVYVYRNGLDMAYSTNQNQLKLWGSIFFNEKNIDITPRNSLKYWCLAHKRMLDLQKTYPNKILMLNFDALCLNTESVLNELAMFLGSGNSLQGFEELIKIPSSIGRYKEYSLSNFDSNDIEYINKIYNEQF